MKTETQHLILIILGLALITSLIKENQELALLLGTALATFLSTKNLTEKQSEELRVNEEANEQ